MRRGADLPNNISVNEIMSVLRLRFSKKKFDINGHTDCHDFPEIIYIMEGDHVLTLDGKLVEIKEGQMMIYAPFSKHGPGKPSDAKVLIISFRISWSDIYTLYNRPITLNDNEKEILYDVIDKGLNKLTSVYVDEYEGKRLTPKEDIGEYELVEIKKQLELFLASVANNQNESPRKADFEQIVRFLKDNVYSSLTLSEIAERNSISVSKLKMIFRENQSCGAVDYFLNLKIDKAKKLLREGKYNVTQISERLGFNSIHYFSRLFKARVGVSPTEYIKNDR